RMGVLQAARLVKGGARSARAASKSTRTFEFTTRLERPDGSWFHRIMIPVAVSRAAGKRGPVPVVVLINGVAEVRASIVPCGGGRHRLLINARARAEAKAKAGDRVAVELRVDESPVGDPMPHDLAHDLRRLDVLAAFERLPIGKRNHIVRFIEEAVAETTREKRIAMAVEVALAASEKEFDRANAVGKRRLSR